MLAWLTKSALPSSTAEFSITLPDDELWLADFFGALTPLMAEENWQQHSTLTPEEMSDYWRGVLLSQIQNLERAMPVGAIIPYGGSFAPGGFLMCDGDSYLRDDYPGLFAVIGTDFGAVDSTHFNVPLLENRVPLGFSATKPIASTGGAETHTLTIAQIPAHDHAPPSPHTNFLSIRAGGGFALPSAGSAGGQPSVTALTGGGASHNNMQPYLAVNFIIKT
jgi:microcystin-dependent protein